MDKLDIAWGTQYEIARGVSDGRWSWSDVTEPKLHQLRGFNRDAAHRVDFVISGKSCSQADVTSRSLW